ncbi:MAG: hydrogenase iron-sulfur subunit [Desulfarculaceae bacterium]|nr:hydrogenase iron-sulfur subunit [Desulfarculaceae bacterium]MCF8072124.1 hydrogenase iron-sulfur subunit [Desulfarculaceae bacterium]MCF8100045.1 hydrogenase iron-sulfur subunit [Desulfarculaceae bacterium]MCF8118148.1 hydrogenase iron-sulfur subunit [Desulfarculaceae bacterium]
MESFQPEVTLLYCRQCLASGAKPVEGRRAGEGFSARLVVLPCSSKVQLPHLMRLLQAGSDAVQIAACPEKACQHLVGSNRAENRVKYGQDLLETVGMGAGRLGLERGAGLSLDDLLELAGRRAEAVRALGPNPMKGV